MPQSIRIDNIWQSATSYISFTVNSPDQSVEVVYTPSPPSGDDDGDDDGRVFLNGFEIDTPTMDKQVSFPSPRHRDEHLQPEDGDSLTASWLPAGTESATYNVYMGTSSDDMSVVSEGQSGTETTFSGRLPCSLMKTDSEMLILVLKASIPWTHTTGVLTLSPTEAHTPAGL